MPPAKTPRSPPQLPDEIIERIFEPVFQHFSEAQGRYRRELDPIANDCLVLSKHFYRILYPLRFRTVVALRWTSDVSLALARLVGDEDKKAWLTRLTFTIFPDFTALHAFALLQLRNLEQLVARGSNRRSYDEHEGSHDEASYHFLPDFWENISRFPRLAHIAYTAEFTWPREMDWSWRSPEDLPRLTPSSTLESATVCFDALNPVIQTIFEESGVQHFGLCLTCIEDLQDSRKHHTGLISFRTMRNLLLEVDDQSLALEGLKLAIDDVMEKMRAQVTPVCLDTLRVEAKDLASGLEASFLPSLGLCAITRCKEFAFVVYDYDALECDFAKVSAPRLRRLELEIPYELAEKGDLARLIKLLPRLPNLVDLQVRRSDLERYN